MDENTLFESESTKTLPEVATLFHYLGDCLRDDSQLTFEQDDQTATITVPSELSVTVEVERETDDAGEETEVEIELQWDADEPDVERQEDPDVERQDEPDVERQDEPDRPQDATLSAHSLLPDEVARTSLGRFEVYRDRANEWRWRLVHQNGNIIATSGEGYTSRQNAEKGLRSVMTNAPGADVTTEAE